MVSRGKQEGVPPSRLPSVEPPAPASSSDYSLATLQTVMEMQKAIGGLTQAVNTLTDQQKEQGKKLSHIEKQIYAAIAVIAIAAAIIGWLGTIFAKVIADVATHNITTPAQTL